MKPRRNSETPKSTQLRSLTAREKRQRVGLLVALTMFALFPAFPVIWMLSSSFKPNSEIFASPPRLISKAFSFDAYRAILTDSTRLRFFINSYAIAIVVTLLTIVISVLSGYAFSRFEFPFKRVIRLLVIGVQAVPPITLLIPYFSLVVSLGMFNTYRGLVLTYMVFTLPYATVMMTSYLNRIPKALDEAARIDGANSFTTLIRVLLPVSIPGLVSVGVYTFMISWNEYLFALTLTKTEDMRTVPIGIQLLMGQHAYDWNEMMAMSILGSAPVLALFVVFQRYFISGLTAGAVKS